MRTLGWPTASTNARVSLARARGTPGWSTIVLRFSTQKVTPAAAPSSPIRSRVRSAVVPHLAGGAVARPCRLAVDQLGGVQVESRNTKCLSGFDGQLGRPHHLVGGGGVDQVAVQVAGHRGEAGAGSRPAPARSLSCQLQISTAKPMSSMRRTRSMIGRSVKTISEHTASWKPRHRSTAFNETGAAVSTDSRAAKAISSATRASAPVTEGSMPACTQSTKWANCAT